MLSWKNVVEMADNGIGFGAHTVNHLHLTRVSIEEAKREIEESKKMISDSTGLQINSFSYPYGEYNEDIKKLVKEAGFVFAFTAKPGMNRVGTDLLELKRIAIKGNDNIYDFKIKIIDKYGILQSSQIKLYRMLRKLSLYSR